MAMQFPRPTTAPTKESAPGLLPITEPASPKSKGTPQQSARSRWLVWLGVTTLVTSSGLVFMRPPRAASKLVRGINTSVPLPETRVIRSAPTEFGAGLRSLPTESGGSFEVEEVLDESLDPNDPEETPIEDRSLGEGNVGDSSRTLVVRAPDPPRASVDPEPRPPDDPRDFELTGEQ